MMCHSNKRYLKSYLSGGWILSPLALGGIGPFSKFHWPSTTCSEDCLLKCEIPVLVQNLGKKTDLVYKKLSYAKEYLMYLGKMWRQPSLHQQERKGFVSKLAISKDFKTLGV